jgi:hypothetical protein
MSEIDPIIDELRKSGLYAHDADDLTIWRQTVQHFQTLPPMERAKAINTVDRMLPDGMTLSRDAAKTFNKKRELEDVDFLLKKAGR